MSRLVILIVVTFLNFALGLIVLTKNPKHWVNRSFSLFAISVACWSGAQVTNLLGIEPAVFWARWSFLMGGTTVLGLVLFFHTFPFDDHLPRTKAFLLIAISALAISLASTLSPWVVSSAANTPRGRVLVYGPLYPVFAGYVFACVGYSFVLMISMIAHAIIRYRLMNVRLIFRRGVVYLVATLIAGTFLVLMLLAADR